MKIKNILSLALSPLAISMHGQAQEKKTSPNLIIILADDMGYADVGFNGCKDIPTPNIDRIANNGVKFTNAYVSYSVSAPSRAGLLTGRYQQRFGFERNPVYNTNDSISALPKSEMNLATSLSKVGYKSGIIGKWHLGADASHHPMKMGFSEFFGFQGGGHNYFPEDLTIKNGTDAHSDKDSRITWIVRGFEPIQTKKYLTDEFSDEAVDFVSRHKDEPFFLYLAYNAPHSPNQATENYLSRFPTIQGVKRKTYAAMVSAVDDGVGRLLDKLQELKIDENTLVFFLSDNGGPITNYAPNGSNNGVLRDGKGSVYEGGFRVPFAFMWKGKIQQGVYDKPISSLDIFATISALTGSPINSNKPLDGVNLIPYLTGKNKGTPHENIYLRMFDNDQFAVRNGQYKLVTGENAEVKELYDLTNDISESNNIGTKEPQKVKEIDAIRVKWAKQLMNPIFGKGKNANLKVKSGEE